MDVVKVLELLFLALLGCDMPEFAIPVWAMLPEVLAPEEAMSSGGQDKACGEGTSAPDLATKPDTSSWCMYPEFLQAQQMDPLLEELCEASAEKDGVILDAH